MILETAGRVLDEHQLCDRCLGRLFARLGRGTNEERGRAIRLVLRMERQAQGDFPVLGGEKCEVCGGIFDELPNMAGICLEKAREIEFSTFWVGSRFPAEVLERERALWEKYGIGTAESIKTEFNRELGKLLSEKLGKEPSSVGDLTFIVNPFGKTVELQIKPVYIYGRYRKLVRGISQTPLKGYRDSVSSIICRPVSREAGGKCVFKGAGREDSDVRMLGNGRPFILEIKNPRRRSLNLKSLVVEINSGGKVEVLDVRFTSGDEARRVLTSSHRKEYLATVFVEEGVSPKEAAIVARMLKGAEIRQRTPRRVKRSRTDKTRIKKVYHAEVRWMDEQRFELRLVTDGGLYIKELISGDEGRTNPSVSGILDKPALCESLDVINILDD
ncbi:tRNA pseudouridine(54/55) synthase Pus10 [Thermococcus sp.]|uniref:tRNA pseudouridine(54/55) synthase Pus10 n=1 Tax=Thermococcus sp. TaxID=35749 RepID=UPI0026037289|nr:tRNA pseudouridine(54/55) synthase Pus10 [Thermococcus sp.]